MRSVSSRRSGLVIVAFAALIVVAVAGAAVIYDQSRRDRLADGITIDGIPVGGLTRSAAAAKLVEQSVTPRRRALTVRADGQAFAVPASRLHVRVDVEQALDRALADSRGGWIGARVVRDLTGGKVRDRLPLTATAAPGVLTQVVASVAGSANRNPQDASVKPDASGLTVKPATPGRAVDTAALRAALGAAVSDPHRSADITATVNAVEPKVTASKLAQKYSAYIIVDRKAHQLRFYRHLKLADTYPIAVGRAGLETPAGLYDVQWKQVNPPWYVPNSPWAGKLAGKTIPPGPRDPIKARWLAFNGGAGIHGIDPSEYGSIGHDASHGCVRMRIPDVIALYARTPVHSPVYVA